MWIEHRQEQYILINSSYVVKVKVGRKQQVDIKQHTSV